MLPGICGLGSRGLTLGVAISTIFYSLDPESGQDTIYTTVPAGFTSARVTIFGHGGTGGYITYDDGTAFWYGGGGGAMSQSVLPVVPGQACSMRFGSGYSEASFRYTDFYIQDALKVRAQNANGMEPGYDGIGQVRYSGGYGGRTQSNGAADSVTGGGAAGTAGNGTQGGYFYSTTGGARGAGQSFTASNGAVAINADGAGSRSSGYGAGKNYGGGGAYNNSGGLGIVIIEWGFGQ